MVSKEKIQLKYYKKNIFIWRYKKYILIKNVFGSYFYIRARTFTEGSVISNIDWNGWNILQIEIFAKAILTK